LSWKSSRIEGNTYTLVDTENLIRRGIEAPGHDKNEARMILNHKEAFKFIQEHGASFATLTKANMQEVHKILIGGLHVNSGFRSKPVGVTGSKYRPLDNIHQITEAVVRGGWKTAHPIRKGPFYPDRDYLYPAV
jgi:Fic family protein